MNLLLRATRALLLAVLLLGSAFTASTAHAASGVRANVTYQARLMDASGYPVSDGVYQVRFSLYDAAVAGTRLWTAAGTTAAPTPVNVSVQDGLFTVLLGDGVTQLPFGDLDWNSDSLYLGVTIGADGEMSPRRPITAVPQAINSAQLGGMSPSSTDTFGGQSQFTINQASTTAATSTRSALDVISHGTSLTNDFILRAITNTGSPAFTITSQGVVSTTNLLVTGQNVCLADGTNCIPASEFDTLATVTARGSTTTVPLTFFGGATVSNLSVTDTATISNLIGTNATFTQVTSTYIEASVAGFSLLDTAVMQFGDATGVRLSLNQATSSYLNWTRATGNELTVVSATFTQATTTNLAASLVSTTQLFVAGKEVCLQDGTNCSSATTTLQAAYNNGRTIALMPDGHIELDGQTGSATDVTYYGNQYTRLIGGGLSDNATTTGFDIAMHEYNASERSVVMLFSNNRDNPGDPAALSSDLYYYSDDAGNYQSMGMENATSALGISSNDAYIYSGQTSLDMDGSDLNLSNYSGNAIRTISSNPVVNSNYAVSTLTKINGGFSSIDINTGTVDPNGNALGNIGDVYYRDNSATSGTQMYLNVDGTMLGWKGVATTDMANLQNSYNGGRLVTLNDGKINLTGVTGAPDEFNFGGPVNVAPVLGAESNTAAGTGFDLGVFTGGIFDGSAFTFTDNRANPNGSLNTSIIYHLPALNNRFWFGSQQIGFFTDNNGATIADGTGDSSIVTLNNLNGENQVHIGADIDPNGTYNPDNAGDFLLRSNSTGGSGTQAYLNVDGTINGWKGVATTDMLSGDTAMALSGTAGTANFAHLVSSQNGKTVSLDFGSNWELFDTSDTANPVSTYTTSSAMSIAKVVDNRLYTVDTNTDTLHVFDISNLYLPLELGSVALGGSSSGDKSIEVVGSTVYVATPAGIYIVNAASSTAMTVLNTIAAPGDAEPLVRVSDGYLYYSAKVSGGNPTTTVNIFDVRNPAAPASLSQFDVTSNISANYSLEISKNDLFVWGMTAPNDQTNVRHYDVTDKSNPVFVNEIIEGINSFKLRDGSLYGSTYDGNRCVKRFAYDGTVEESLCGLNNVSFSDIDGNNFYVTARFFGSGIEIIDLGGTITHGVRASVGDFGQVSVADELTVGGKAHFNNDISVKGVSVCLADGTNCQAGGAGLTSANMSLRPADLVLPNAPIQVNAENRLVFVNYSNLDWALIDATDVNAKAIVYTSTTNPVRTGLLVSDRLYTVDYSNDIVNVIDVSNPSVPVMLGSYNTGSSTVDVAKLAVDGSNIILATADGVTIIDARSPAAMTAIKYIPIGLSIQALAVQNGFMYFVTKNGLLTTLNIYDIRNPAAPASVYSLPYSSGLHNDPEIQIVDRTLFVKEFNGFTGNNIFFIDISDPSSPVSLGTIQPTGEITDHFVATRGRLYISSFDQDSTQAKFQSWILNDNGVPTLEQELQPGFQTTNADGGMESFDIDGGYAFGWGFSGGDYLAVVDLGGLNLRALRVANGDFGTIAIGNNLTVHGFADFANNITVKGQGVCLADGTNCSYPASDWVYTTSTNFLRPASSTANLVIGGTSTTVGFMNAAFTMNGNDLFVGGNIGSASSVYTNGEFVVGPGSTHYGDGYLNKNNGNFTLQASGGFILPSTDLGLSLGSSTTRFNAYLGTVTTTNLMVTGTLSLAGSLDQVFSADSSSSLVYTGSQVYNNASSVRIAVAGNNFFIAHTSTTISGAAIDSFDTREISSQSSVGTVNNAADVVTVNNLVYSLDADNNALNITRVNALASASLIASLGNVGFDFSTSSRLLVKGNYVYIADRTNLYVVDVTSLTTPRLINTVPAFWTNGVFGMDIENNTMIVSERAGTFVNTRIYNITDPAAPVYTTGYGYLDSRDTTAAIYGSNLYILETAFGTLRMRNLNGASLQTWVVGDTTARTLKVEGDYAYILGDSLTVIALKTGQTKVISNAGSYPYAMAISGRYVYTAGRSGYKIYDIGGVSAAGAYFGSVEIGSLNVSNDLNVSQGLSIGSGLTVTNGGALIEDALRVNGTSASSAILFVTNNQTNTGGRAWGAYIDQLLIGNSSTATGTNSYAALIGYGATGTGLCLDDNSTAATCPGSTGVSIEADGAINASAFDLAERYNASGTVEAGDLIQFADGATSTVEASHGIAYDPRAIGVISTEPGFILGWEGNAQVALAGRVPVKVTVANGVIRVGDKLTSSNVTGTAMKATRPGMTVGIALQDADADGVVEMFVQPEFSLSSAINTDGSIQFKNESGSTTFSVDAAGNGYFLGDVSATSFTTHAAFDLAERYSSPDQLERGDLVMINPNAEMQMVRTAGDASVAIGIVSSAPGFTLGAATTDTYPIALAGRVPTKVSNMNGEIKPGDALTVSSLPGVAVKAVDAGMIVGYALQSYNGNDTGLIEVFVQAGYWKPSATYSVATSTSMGPTYQGFAKILDGATRVHVSFASLLAYPAPVITPMSTMPTVWRLENITDTGFDIVIESNPGMDIVFYWQVNAIPNGLQMTKSDGTTVTVDALTGQEVIEPAATSTP